MNNKITRKKNIEQFTTVKDIFGTLKFKHKTKILMKEIDKEVE